MRRPISAVPLEVFETYLHAAVAPIQSRVKREAQTRDCGDLVDPSGTSRQYREPIFRRRHICGQQFALGHVKFDSEDELVVVVPALLGQQGSGGREVRERRGVGGRHLRALARDEIQFGDLLTFLS